MEPTDVLTAHPILYISFVGGLFGAIWMAMAYDLLHDNALLPTDYFLAAVFDEDPTRFEVAGILLYLALGSAAGTLFPVIFRRVVVLDPVFVYELPYTFVSAFAFSIALMALTAGLIAAGLFGSPRRGRPDWLVVLAPFLVYGFVLALVTGLSRSVWIPLLRYLWRSVVG